MSKKKVVTTTSASASKEKIKPTASKVRSSSVKTSNVELTFHKENYKWMAIGFGVLMLGMLLMMGGRMPSDDVWEPGRIYSFTRTVIAPVFILAGLVIEIYAIFKAK
ncbi:MAG: DUF3098 domain-containing protein [Lewinellaceae bacterium]|nr:DUF3098 domain-containing protein [Saprospiraceae bacterium]MCB9269375.1 DUF3098 domain-containing protein [Lewinellaceae bacterium]HPG07003.1 DUF3098 domain-containing protein [Saprospiraceae bacterium]HPR00204.1 DUF3098 domain-containing protein [Saprospiraceae bacterium]HQU53489.1 DUF3098 domain-containing protein [Saprospiraceae bacterium]